ncbi:MAG: major facilitator superfamily transporter [Frankiales bacterium]|nr:major facilitator superfamily transporter [Frankiales bacterium]
MDVAEQVTGAAAEKRGLLVAFGVFGSFWGAWAAILPAVKAQTGASDGGLGLALALIAFAALPATLVGGRVVDRVGAARVLPATMLLFAISAPLPGLAHGVEVLLPGFVLLGLGSGAFDIAVNAATAGWERRESDRLMAAGHAAFSAGVVVGSVSSGLARQQGARPLPVLLVVAVVIAVAAWRQPSYRPTTDEAPAPRRRRMPAAILLALGVLVAAAFLLEDALQSWSALQLERGLGASPAVSGLGPGLFAASMAVGRLLAHVVSRPGREHVVVAAGGLAAGTGAVLLSVAPGQVTGLAALALAGAGTSVLAPLLFSAIGARSAPGREGADLSTASGLGYVGFLAGPPLVGAISAGTSLPVALGSLGVFGLLIAVAGPIVLRRPVAAAQDR